MAQILVRGLAEDELRRLRKHAKNNDRSLEAEARVAIREAALRPTREDLEEFREWAAAIRKRFKGRVRGDSADIIRADRDSH
jgi:plasmid stability protein